MLFAEKRPETVSLRWHYPNQVMGQDIQSTLSKVLPSSPSCRILYKYSELIQYVLLFKIVFTVIYVHYDSHTNHGIPQR